MKGAYQVARTVQQTLGPGGRNVILQSAPNQQDSFLSLDSPFRPYITKDGVTVAKALNQLRDPLQTIGAKLICDAADQTNELCGDGTTTSTIIAYNILREGIKQLQHGKVNPVELRKGIQKSVEAICQEIDKISKKISVKDNIEDIRSIAFISSNGDKELADLIAEIHQKIGFEGTISIQEGKGHLKTVVQYIDGYSVDQGFLSPYFTDQQNKSSQIDYENGVYIVTIDQIITSASQIVPFLEFAKKTYKPVIIIAQDFEAEPLTTMVVNKLQNNLKICAVKAPMINGRDYLEDLSILTGSTMLSPELGYNRLERLDPVYVVGKCDKVQISKDSTVIIRGHGQQDLVDHRIKLLEEQISDNIMLGDYDKEKIQERIAKFRGGIAIIKAGGRSEVAMNECRDRIEDSVFAVRSALEEGIVIGGGCALFYAAQNALKEIKLSNDDQIRGRDIVMKISEIPLRKIYENTLTLNSGEGGVIIEKLKQLGNQEIGYDAREKKINNLIEKQVIDPKKVVKSALRFGAGLASILLTAECAIVEEKYNFNKRIHDQITL
ncbi:molecular chaperone [Stylonychia lemnae]|uniref:Molecular chaperone n=1 Tax=Stylonychia lemnae TaxID=5949 RepID=A0A078AY48_STYLE|nr:molecular chaperone [Stylonychia lemnae]|eukprot:CDW87350.1 molecular chaperone [Stylonychia lemnae]